MADYDTICYRCEGAGCPSCDNTGLTQDEPPVYADDDDDDEHFGLPVAQYWMTLNPVTT